MKYHLIIALSFLNISGVAGSSDNSPNMASNTNSIMDGETECYDPWKGHKILVSAREQQYLYQTKLAEIQTKIDSLNSEVMTKLAEAKSARETIDRLKSQYFTTKNNVKDPWREVYGDKKYVLPIGAAFIKFSGQIQEAAANGIRVFGQIGESNQIEYFVINFPYDFKAGESVDPTKIYVGLQDGTYSYVSEDGYAKTLPKLNYGKPCARPENADAIEQLAEESQVNGAKEMAKVKDDTASATQTSLQAAMDEISAVRKEAAEKTRLAVEESFQYDLTYANKGNLDALRRMSERYRIGDGVEIDTNKAAEYNQKYEEMFQTEAERIAEKQRLAEQADLRQKFLQNVFLADQKDNVQSALYVENCYRNGIGTEKDLIKAEKYHALAVRLGIPRLPNTQAF